MFSAKVYKICIASAGGALSEEYVAQDTVAKWNVQYGEESGIVYLLVPQTAKPDIYVFVIDNYIDASKVDAALATSEKVILFFSSYHDPKNTLLSELKAVEEFRKSSGHRCVCVDFNGTSSLEKVFLEQLSKTNIINF